MASLPTNFFAFDESSYSRLPKFKFYMEADINLLVIASNARIKPCQILSYNSSSHLLTIDSWLEKD